MKILFLISEVEDMFSKPEALAVVCKALDHCVVWNLDMKFKIVPSLLQAVADSFKLFKLQTPQQIIITPTVKTTIPI